LAVAREVEAGFREVFPDAEYVALTAADGGEGTAEALVAASGGGMRSVMVRGPLGEPVQAMFGVLGDGCRAVIEMAQAAGLDLVPRGRRDPLRAGTFGVGEMIRAALNEGCRHLVLGLGGSATTDGGVGMMQALGVSFRDGTGRELGAGGAALADLVEVDVSGLDARLAACRIEVACDVDNPLTGAHGAAAVFGPQKGASASDVMALDEALERYGAVLTAYLGQDVGAVPGAGAAGGMGAAALAFLGATLRPGVEIVLEALGLERVLEGADLVVTGEGRIDGQTARGKAPVGVARVAARCGVPVVAIAGALGPGVEAVYECGIGAVFSVVNRACSLEEALGEAVENVRVTARNVAAVLRMGRER